MNVTDWLARVAQVQLWQHFLPLETRRILATVGLPSPVPVQVSSYRRALNAAGDGRWRAPVPYGLAERVRLAGRIGPLETGLDKPLNAPLVEAMRAQLLHAAVDDVLDAARGAEAASVRRQHAALGRLFAAWQQLGDVMAADPVVAQAAVRLASGWSGTLVELTDAARGIAS